MNLLNEVHQKVLQQDHKLVRQARSRFQGLTKQQDVSLEVNRCGGSLDKSLARFGNFLLGNLRFSCRWHFVNQISRINNGVYYLKFFTDIKLKFQMRFNVIVCSIKMYCQNPEQKNCARVVLFKAEREVHYSYGKVSCDIT